LQVDFIRINKNIPKEVESSQDDYGAPAAIAAKRYQRGGIISKSSDITSRLESQLHKNSTTSVSRASCMPTHKPILGTSFKVHPLEAMNLNQEMDKRNEASISEQRSRRDDYESQNGIEMGVQADDFPELDALQEIHDTLLEES
jgi:hypothetical protein